MNLHHLLQARHAAGKPVRVALIGAGKFGSMFLAQVPHTQGLEVPLIIDIDRDRARKALAKLFDEVDVLLTFSAPGAAPKGLTSTGEPRFNRLWTLMGVPCVNIPAYVAEGGLPVGVQVIARFGNDARALAAAWFLEEALKRG